ncbi:hypothetical protein K3495_g3275 [Podosphaera aphanis]|nr:hypothetical protein K3495_g3275 [Podosphaera aphanis]
MEVYEGVSLTETEKKVLELYCRLEELQLEIALRKAQGTNLSDEPTCVSEGDIDTAQSELLRARASFQFRNSVTENVIIADPIINSTQTGQRASKHEQKLATLLQKRDELSLDLLEISKKERDAREDLIKLEVEHIHTVNKNANLSKKMLQLANTNNEKSHQAPDELSRQKLVDMETQMKVSHRKWKLLKGLVSATIVGSGVDWVRRTELLPVVLNEDD